MKHLSKFYLNQTVNESENAVLRKLRKLEKFVAPNAWRYKNGAWRYKTSARRFLLCEKYEKQRFCI